MKNERRLFAALALLATCSALEAQVHLDQLDAPVLIDFSSTVAGVNNGAFDAQSPIGTVPPGAGQLDQNAWDYFFDGSAANAAQGVANFPGSLPNGNGLGTGGSLPGGVSAVDIAGHRCLAVQPTSTNWTSGNLTLRVLNNTGQVVDRLHITYTLFYLNDQQRSNDLHLFYSTSGLANSFNEVAAATVTSPADSSIGAQWVENDVDVTIGGLALGAGYEIYLRWVGNDVSGSGARDEFAITDIGLTAQLATGPWISASTTSPPAFQQNIGAPGTAQQITVGGALLIQDISATVTAPFEISLDGSNYAQQLTIPQVAGTVAPTALYIRLNSANAGAFAGAVTLTSTDALPVEVVLEGTAMSGSFPILYINELMSSNNSSVADPNGEFDDWFELFNPGASPINLAGWYATDDPALLTKYQFALDSDVALVPAHGWLLVWADNQSLQGDLHTDFSLSSSGEFLAITAPDGVSIADSITFGPLAADVSFGRQYDGSEPWVEFNVPTPEASNNPQAVVEVAGSRKMQAWPVPAHDVLNLSSVFTGRIVADDGRTVRTTSNAHTVDLSGLPAGLYTLFDARGRCLRFVKD